MQDSVAGSLSTAAHLWTAAAPALGLLVYLAAALLAYQIRRLVRGPWRDPEMEARAGGGLSRRPVRVFFAWLMHPLVTLFVRLRIPPNAITSLSLALSLGAGVSLSMGYFALGGFLYVGAGLCDFLDGTVARRSSRVTPGGAVLDSVLDRYSETAVLLGLAWFYRDRWVLLLVLAALSGSLLVPYVRARGEAVGAAMASVGFMQRPERVMILGATVLLSPIVEALFVPAEPRPMHRLAVAGLAVLAVGTHATAAARTLHLMRAVRPAPARSPARISRFRYVFAVLAGTAVDYGVMHLTLNATPAPIPIATMAGYCAGFLVALGLLGAWTHGPSKGPLHNAPSNPTWWLFCVASGAVLNGGGAAILALVPALGLPLTWLAVRLIILFTWTRPLIADGLRPILDSSQPQGDSSS